MSDPIQTPTSQPESIDPRHRLLLEEASAQLQFNNYPEAETALEEIPNHSAFFLEAQLRLLAIDHDLSRFEEGVQRGLRLIEDFGVESVPLVTVVNCLIFQCRFTEALELVRKHRFHGLRNPSGYYDVACIESKLGHFGSALWHLERSFRGGEQYDVLALFDFHLLPLWRRLGTVKERDLGPETRRCLASPVFRRVLKAAHRPYRFLPIDHEALQALPAELRSLFQVRFQGGRFHVFHQTRTAHPERFRRVCTWQRRRILVAATFLENARSAAAGPAAEVDRSAGPPRSLAA